MTTIAYKDGVIAYDSRRCSGSTIVDDDYDKRHEHEGVSFFLTGAVCDLPRLIAAYFGEKQESPVECTALVVDDGKLQLVGYDKDSGLWVDVLPQDKPYSIGSGSDHAWTAMDMGATAYQAIGLAMKRDSCTGGNIRTFQIDSVQSAE
ncbi:proteasome subunit beta [Pseudomonas sp.]|uniref:proteasome subunit beta n=1 Tax=Pseudomonas sp. TaxID=306 RepID=UPI00291199F0|nr:proteasome subunit beta [Pseudomonas sp.]MDU4249020.1 proteasome subunit beta [Pseudomonas sp.]